MELWPKRTPVLLQNGVEIVVFVPVLSCFVIDRAARFIEDRLRVAVRADWRVHRLPYVELIARPAMVAQGGFIGDVVAHRDQRLAQVVAHGRLFYTLVGACNPEHVLAGIQVGR